MRQPGVSPDLYNMCQFVGQELPACWCRGVITPSRKRNIAPKGVGVGADRSGGLCGATVRMHTYLTEIMT